MGTGENKKPPYRNWSRPMREAPEGEEADGDSEGDAPEAPDSVPAGNIILGATSEVRRAFTAKTMAKARPLEHPILSKKQDTARPYFK